jgi:hypothetical protein
MDEIYLSSDDVANAFPACVRDDARVAASTFPATRVLTGGFSVRVGNEIVILPSRIHNDPALIDLARLTDLQREFVDCLLTRHTDGVVREQHLARIIGSRHVWVPPFVIQLVGEYVVEILRVIYKNLHKLDPLVYASFLHDNQEFFSLTEARVNSYWNCYHRDQKREEYVGFQLLEFFRSLPRNRD